MGEKWYGGAAHRQRLQEDLRYPLEPVGRQDDHVGVGDDLRDTLPVTGHPDGASRILPGDLVCDPFLLGSLTDHQRADR